MAREASREIKTMQSTIEQLSLEQIDEPITPMRTGLEQTALIELADSIRQLGLINPITVRKKGERYEVVAGHRRFKACAIAGVFRIPCVISDVTDAQAFDVMAAENLNRTDIDPVEEALFIGRLVGEDNNKIPEIAKRINRSVPWVEDRLELLVFSERILVALKEGKIKLGVAQWLGRVEDDFWQQKFLDQAIGQGMSVLQARYLHDQFRMGIYPKAGDILPGNEELAPSERSKIKVECARCGTMAVEPNFQSVFIHMECPKNEAQPVAV